MSIVIGVKLSPLPTLTALLIIWTTTLFSEAVEFSASEMIAKRVIIASTSAGS